MRSWSLRTRLIILVLIILIPLVGLQILNIRSRFEETYSQELDASQEYAEAIEAAFLNYLNSIWDMEQAVGVALTSDGGNFDSMQISKYFKRLLESRPDLEDFAWILPNGRVHASSFLPIVGRDASQLRHFQLIKNGQKKVVTDVMYNSIIQGRTVVVAKGVYDSEGELVGILASSLKLNQLGEVLPKNRLNPKATFGFVDQRANLVYRNNTNVQEELVVAQNSPIRAALAGEAIVSRKFISSFNGEERLGAMIPIDEIGWAAFVTASVDEVLASARRGSLNNIYVILVVIGIALVFISIFNYQFVYPIKQLQQAALQIASNNLNARAEIKGKDELAMTGLIFDEMAKRVQEFEENRLHFLHTAAHELRNPMAGIKGLLALITRKIESGKPVSNIAGMLKTMEKEIDRLSRLLNEILEAFRVQQEKSTVQYHFDTLDLAQLVNNSLKIFAANDNCQIHFQNHLTQPVFIKGDPDRLEEVIRNLVDNSIKFSSTDSQVKLELSREGGRLLLAVHDHGMGIPKDKLDSIFGLFARNHSDHLQDQGGMGLGLYISREIIQRHGGEIWAESDGQTGSTFKISLPIATD